MRLEGVSAKVAGCNFAQQETKWNPPDRNRLALQIDRGETGLPEKCTETKPLKNYSKYSIILEIAEIALSGNFR